MPFGQEGVCAPDMTLPAAAPLVLAPGLAPGATVEVRPPPGLARGLVSVPSWVVLAAAGALLVGTLVYLVWRGRHDARRGRE